MKNEQIELENKIRELIQGYLLINQYDHIRLENALKEIDEVLTIVNDAYDELREGILEKLRDN